LKIELFYFNKKGGFMIARTFIMSALCAGFIFCISNTGRTNGVANDGETLYISDLFKNVIYRVDTTSGKITVLAGKSGKSGSANGKGGAVRFNNPNGIAHDADHIYVADSMNNAIRKINKMTGVVSTLAGSPGQSGSTDGMGTAARFNNPTCISIVGDSLYITDSQNQLIRKIDKETGAVSTIAGSAGQDGSADGSAVSSRFKFPTGIASDGKSLFVADTGNHIIRRIDIASGKVTTLAGTAGILGAANGTGPSAELNTPKGIACDGKNLYVTDPNNHLIRKIVIAAGEVSTLAGLSGSHGLEDGTGTKATFAAPENISYDAELKIVYVTDNGTEDIRKIDVETGAVTTLKLKLK
jgi:sugar lactone lactonase YvrE